MKKLLSVILLLGMILCGCAAALDDKQIAEALSAYENGIMADVQGNTVTEEDLSGSGGIISSEYVINDNKYYFVTRRASADGFNNNKMITYHDLETGECYGICRDPLCDHETRGDCKYAGFKTMYFTDDPHIFYSIYDQTDDFRPLICRINLLRDTVEVLHTCGSFMTVVLGIDNNRLYFYENEQITENRQTVQKEHLYYLDLNTDMVVDMGYFPESYTALSNRFLLLYQNEIYYTTSDNKLAKTELMSEHRTDLYDMGEEILLYWYYDTKTDELYFNLIDKEKNTGGLYVYRNGMVEQIVLPHENIFTFALTNSEIYYSIYDPVYYGVSKAPGNPQVYDYSGGKVYAADRSNPAEAELVYDSAGEYVICSTVTNYQVFGGRIYFDEKAVIRETVDGVDYTYFASANDLSKICVDLKTGEILRLQFE